MKVSSTGPLAPSFYLCFIFWAHFYWNFFSRFGWFWRKSIKQRTTDERWGEQKPKRINNELVKNYLSRNSWFQGVKRCEKYWKVSVKEFDFLTARGNSLIFIYDKPPAKRQISKPKILSVVSDFVNLPNCQGKESYTHTMQKQSKSMSSWNLLRLCTTRFHLIIMELHYKRDFILFVIWKN